MRKGKIKGYMNQVRAKKALGQHFLTDLNIARKIATSLSGGTAENPDKVLEVGCGMGVLTQFLLQRDDEVEETMDRKTEGRDMSSIPSSLFVYDYNLNLKKIINMPFRMLRLCGDVESNTVYAMAINPEFELISIDLE